MNWTILILVCLSLLGESIQHKLETGGWNIFKNNKLRYEWTFGCGMLGGAVLGWVLISFLKTTLSVTP
jgi:hypothetical protein